MTLRPKRSIRHAPHVQRPRVSESAQERRRAGEGAGHRTGRAADGILLIECLAYIGLLFVVLGVACMVFYRFWDSSLGLQRSADDIVRALKAGERWRADVRAATAPLRSEESAQGQALRIPHANDEVVYAFVAGGVWRRANETAPWVPVLPRVKSSRMTVDVRQHVVACRWELELKSKRDQVRTRPLFSFQAVPTQAANP